SVTRPVVRRLAAWTALAVGGLLPSTGCQVEYAGMTLPSGKYMHDDVQYFPPGPDFPWANTQAATQRARMQALGIEVAPPGPPGRGSAGGPRGGCGRGQTKGGGRPQPTGPPGRRDPPPPPPRAPGAAPAPAPAVPAPPAPGVVPPQAPGAEPAPAAPGGN